jgi:hypothetical protein
MIPEHLLIQYPLLGNFSGKRKFFFLTLKSLTSSWADETGRRQKQSAFPNLRDDDIFVSGEDFFKKLLKK